MAAQFVISDFVPYLAFVTTLQGVRQKMEGLRDFMMVFAHKMFELESHKQRAKERASGLQSDGTTTYVPDFVDLLLQAPLEDGDILPDKNLNQNLLVRTFSPSVRLRVIQMNAHC